MEQRTWQFFGYDIEPYALGRGAATSLVVVLALGVGVGTLVEEGSNLSVLVTALIAMGFIFGGVVAGVLSTKNHLIHGMLTAVPVAVLGLVVQIIRRITSDDAVHWLSLVFISFLASSLGTLGGIIGGRFSPTRRSLLDR